MKEYQAYLFDWDGTLGRTLEAWLEVVREMFARYDLTDLTDDQLVDSLGALKPKAKEFGLEGKRLEDFFSETETLARQKIPQADMYEGSRQVLETLRNEGKKIALITTGWRTTIDGMLEAHGLEDAFDIVITGNDVSKHKPDPEGILKVLSEFGVDTSAAVMIGDSSNDLLAAQGAGIDSVLFYPPSHQLFYDLPTLKGHAPKRIISGWHEFMEGITT